MNSWELVCSEKAIPGEQDLQADLCTQAMINYNANEKFWSTTVLLLVAVCLCLGTYFVIGRVLKSRNPGVRTFEFFAVIFDFLVLSLGVALIYRASTALDSEIYDRDILVMKGISLIIGGVLVCLAYRVFKRWVIARKKPTVDIPQT